MANKMFGNGVSNWQPAQPTKTPESSQLLEPNAKDAPEALNATNVLKQSLGGSGKPKGPFGLKGRDF